MANGKSIFSVIVTDVLIIAVIYFIVFVLIGAGGGFSALFNIGGILAKIGGVLATIPAWFYIVVALIWLVKSMFG